MPPRHTQRNINTTKEQKNKKIYTNIPHVGMDQRMVNTVLHALLSSRNVLVGKLQRRYHFSATIDNTQHPKLNVFFSCIRHIYTHVFLYSHLIPNVPYFGQETFSHSVSQCYSIDTNEKSRDRLFYPLVVSQKL